MNSKRAAIVALATVNVVLLLLLVAQVVSLPSAYAQTRPGGGGYVCAAARAAGRTYEAMHMIDLSTRRLHTFYPDQAKLLFTAAPRDLDKDFGK